MIITCTIVFQNSCTPSKGKEHKENKTKFLVSSTVKMDTTITEEYVCQINSIRHIELRAQEKGYLEHIYVDEGKFVRKGQLLFKIMPRIYEAELQKARAEADFANIEYQNTKSLADRKIVATNELAMAKARLDKANAEMALAQVHLDFTEIRAPFDGIIDRFHVREGSLVEEGELLTHLSDNSKMWVYYNVPEAEYLDFQSNLEKDSLMEVKLLMANNKMFGYSGVVETIEADFNNETGNIPFRATFPNPEGLLRHGETGNIRMAVPLQNALIIPQKATFEILDKKYVFVVDKDNRIKTREITIIAEMEDLYAIGYGLEEKEKILLEGLRKVKENEEITFDYKKPEAVIASLKLYAE
ncbi:efflux RND transporter periplasmic adaptor subunit [Flexithrix dorotheae]|uniref:efflux RND transporter periplasmic adaptor subunit n=1 Tax=Flexithrix dorotheae TaxID=70993 RepID=UPI001FE2049D|nr:efflux RND transporter periplasmic adaptor subunit [Flexithrix dorotheae]